MADRSEEAARHGEGSTTATSHCTRAGIPSRGTDLEMGLSSLMMFDVV